jgi:predicted phage gp36 major capsid-like protein
LQTQRASSSNSSKAKLSAPRLFGAEAARAKRVANKNAIDYLGNVVDWVSSMTFPQLVRAIYAKYPAFKANSVFAG